MGENLTQIHSNRIGTQWTPYYVVDTPETTYPTSRDVGSMPFEQKNKEVQILQAMIQCFRELKPGEGCRHQASDVKLLTRNDDKPAHFARSKDIKYK